MICEIQTSDLLIIIGIAAAAVLLIALIVAAAIVRRKNKRGASDAEPASVEPVAADEDPVAEEKTQPYGGTEPNACEDASGPAAAGEPEDGAKQESTDKKPVQRVRTSRRAAGSWTVEYKRLGEYVAVLCAKNGEVMLSSETYSSEEGARAGINTIVKNITGNGTFVIYRDKNDNYYFKLKTTGNKLLCVGETYRSKDQCAKAVESVRRLAPSAPVAGELGFLDVELGQNISVGQMVGRINVLTGHKIEAEIDEHYIDRVVTGLSGEFDRRDTTFSLKVKKVYPDVREGKFQADLEFVGEKPSNIRNGQSYYINLQLGESSESVIIPRGSFFSQTGGTWIFVLDAAGERAVRREIRLGRQNPQYYEVLEGISPGEQVIVSGYELFGNNDELILR